MSTIQPVQPADLIRMRRLCEGLAQWAYTDFDQARTALQELEGLVTAQTPFDIRPGLSPPPRFSGKSVAAF
ncbi:MAG: hypothetical protein IPM36_04910 [Lewinellaceae bacterium]|nr:hypothetical protein [Lewinellaceae bacterium]